MFYVLICGSRNYNDYNEFEKNVNFLLKNKNLKEIEIVSGGAKGVDTLAEEYSKKYHINNRIFRARWDTFGKRAGYIRNMEMITYLKAQKNSACIAFWDEISNGTKHSIKNCIFNKIPIRIYSTKQKKFIKYCKNGHQ